MSVSRFIFATLGLGAAGLVLLLVLHRPTPDAIQIAPLGVPVGSREGDAKVIATLKATGADVSKSTEIIHYLYVPKELDARAAARALEEKEFSLTIRPPGPQDRTWMVKATEKGTPSIEHFDATRPLFRDLARRFDGQYDGWEAAVTR